MIGCAACHFCYGFLWTFYVQVNKYLENYDRALAGFEAAALKDPSLNASEEVEKMVNLLNKLEILLRIKEGDQLTLLEPHFRNIDFSWKGKCYQFKSIRVDFLEQVLVNGKALPPHQAIRTSIYAQHKP
ncbi:hypothetical protein GOBAR_DD10174 [Gossypium barbadense]|nr:hypothetical protein GOBAR_DD10174 [Gossypium barbadense]